MLAVIFQNWYVAEILVNGGAIIALPFVAGMGRMDLVKTFFDANDRFTSPWPTMPHWDTVSNPQEQIDAGLTLGAMGRPPDVVRFLLDRGANINAVIPVDTTALDEAVKNNHGDVADFLRDAGAMTFEELNS